jgi:hypothetical protein
VREVNKENIFLFKKIPHHERIDCKGSTRVDRKYKHVKVGNKQQSERRNR